MSGPVTFQSNLTGLLVNPFEVGEKYVKSYLLFCVSPPLEGAVGRVVVVGFVVVVVVVGLVVVVVGLVLVVVVVVVDDVVVVGLVVVVVGVVVVVVEEVVVVVGLVEVVVVEVAVVVVGLVSVVASVVVVGGSGDLSPTSDGGGGCREGGALEPGGSLLAATVK